METAEENLTQAVVEHDRVLQQHHHQLAHLGTAMDEVLQALRRLETTGLTAPADANPVPQASAQASVAYPTPSLNLSLPEQYDGHPDKCRSFLLQCNLYFAHRSG